MIRIDVNNNNKYFGKFEIMDEQAYIKEAEALGIDNPKANKRKDDLGALCSALYYIIDSAIRDNIKTEDLTAALDYAKSAIPVTFDKWIGSEDDGADTIEQGEHFIYNGMEFICLDVTDESIFAIMAKCYDELPFNTNYEDGCNNWAESSLRRVLNEDLLSERFDEAQLIKQTTDLTADNGDTKYGTCEDYLTLLTCDQYRKYRQYVPLFDECMWTVTPWRCDASYAYVVRFVSASGALSYLTANNTYGVAPACLFNRSVLKLRRQAHKELCAREETDND